MNRKQRIIVSVTGIFLVLLILVGLTYAYFLTKIKGNDNQKSISVTTANLELTYGDNSAEILGKNLTLIPSDTEIGTKTFTVTNNGNDTSYVVVVENVSVTKASDGSNTTFNSNDFRYKLTCTKKDGTSCDGVSTQSVFPINGGVLVGNSIKEGDVHTYTFKMWYIDTGIDQSNDMGKSLQARLNITDIRSMTNPYSANTNSLAYNIIENTKSKANGTELLSSPKTQVATAISTKWGTGKYVPETVTTESLCSGYDPWLVGDTETAAQSGSTVSSYDDAVGKYVYDQCDSWTKKLLKYDSKTNILTFDNKVEIYDYEKNMSVATDDYGTSYYYRGNVIDNYVNFAGMCWRIVRISGDGSIKLILEDQDEVCSSTMNGNWNIPTTTGGTINYGNFGYTEYEANTLTASDGTKNAKTVTNIDYLNGGTENTESMATAFKNFQTGPLANYLDKLKAGDWCLNDKAYATSSDNTTSLTSQEILDKQVNGPEFYYDSWVRLKGKTMKEPTLKCNGTNMDKFADNTDMYVGTLTADEIVYAGGKADTSNPDYYLINNYQKSTRDDFWSLSPFYFNSVNNIIAFAIRVDYSGTFEDSGYVSNASGLRPAVSLKSSVQITGGNGTKANAYTIG